MIRSFRFRLTVWYAVVLLLILAGLSTSVYFVLKTSLDRALQAQLDRDIETVATVVAASPHGKGSHGHLPGNILFAVMQDGWLVYHSDAWCRTKCVHGAEIGDDCLIGIGAVVMDRAKIGRRCVIGETRGLAGAVQWKSTDYSAVLLRAVIGGRARVFALGYAGNGNVTYSQNRIRAIVDLEGDGVMEVVTSWAYYEGDGSELWRYSHGRVRSLAEVGQGL